MQQPQRVEDDGQRDARVGGDGGPEIGITENGEQDEHGFHAERGRDVLADDAERAVRMGNQPPLETGSVSEIENVPSLIAATVVPPRTAAMR